MSRRLPSEVVISRSSSRPTCTKLLSARSIPISSQVSRSAVYTALSSDGSCRPPGNAMWLLHLLPAPPAGARLMNRSSGTVSGWLTQSGVSGVR